MNWISKKTGSKAQLPPNYGKQSVLRPNPQPLDLPPAGGTTPEVSEDVAWLETQMRELQGVVASQQRQMRGLEQDLQQRDRDLDWQCCHFYERQQQWSQILTLFEGKMETMRGEVAQLKARIWWQRQVMQDYQRQLLGSWTHQEIELRQGQRSISEAENKALAHVQYGQQLAIELKSARETIEILYDYVATASERVLGKADSPCALKSVSQTVDLDQLLAEAAQLQEAIDAQAAFLMGKPTTYYRPQSQQFSPIDILTISPNSDLERSVIPKSTAIDLPKFSK